MAFGSGRSDRYNPFRYGATAPKPKREVFLTDEIPHLWANQTQSRARNAQGNLFFDGRTIYSYRTSWPLACIYTKPSNAPKITRENALVLVNSERYSITTSQHQSNVCRAVSHLPQIAVPYPAGTFGKLGKHEHSANLKYLTRVSARELAKAHRALSAWRVDSSLSYSRALIADAVAYMDFFGIRRVRPVFPEDSAQRALARIRSILNPDPVRNARKIKARENRRAALRRALQAGFDNYCQQVETYNTAVRAARAALPAAPTQEQIEQHWRDTGEWLRLPQVSVDVPIPPRLEVPGIAVWRSYAAHTKMRAAGFTLPAVETARGVYTGGSTERILLRVSGEEIVTSWGARIPLAAAPMIWNLIQRTRAACATYKPTHTVRIGVYNLDEISPDGTLRAGCHTIAYDELARMARALGLTSEENHA